MFLLVSFRHVGAHPGGHQHGVYIQISINLGKTFLQSDISYTKYSSGLNLGEGLCIFTSSHFPDSGLCLLKGLIFILIYFEWRDTESQQYSGTLLLRSLMGQKNLAVITGDRINEVS